jgi:hypothetical protein
MWARPNVPTRTMNICLDDNVNATNTIQLHLVVFVISPVTHLGHIGPTGIVLLVSYSRNKYLV